MILEMFLKRRLNGLVKQLNKAGELNEDNAKFVNRFVKRNRLTDNLLMLFMGLPFTLHFIYVCHHFLNETLNTPDPIQYFWLIFLCTFLVLGLLFFCYCESTNTEWKYVHLMTNGQETEGYVSDYWVNVSISGYSTGKYCTYIYFDNIGYGYDSKIKIPIKFDDDFEFSPGEQITVLFDPKNPKFSMIATPKFRKFNLRKN